MTQTRMAALDGVKVLDLCQVGAGPYCSTLLGDLGAEVVKVEPIGGEPTRSVDNFFAPKESAYYFGINRSKKAIALDIKSKEGHEILLRLAKWADVVTVSMRPATVDRLGLSYDNLRKVNDRIVYLSVTAFGEDGPRAEAPGMDIVAQALSGVMALTGEPDQPPVKCGASVADWTTSFLSAFAIVSALRARDRDGVGQKVAVSLLDASLSLLPQFVSSYRATGVAPRRSGSGHPMVVPYQVFLTADGNIIVACLDDRFWPRLCNALERPELIADERFATNSSRVKRRAEIVGIVQAILATKTTEEWVSRFEKLSVPHAPVLELEQVVEDPQVIHNEMILTLEHPRFGKYQVVNNPIRMSATPAVPHGYSPGVGEHTDEVLAGVGYSEEELGALRDAAIIE